MAAMNAFDSLSDLEAEEKLFTGITSGPFEQYEGLLESLEDVDFRGMKQRTLLHLGVRLGKLDWVEGLLAKGADPCLKDGGHETAMNMAKKLSKRCPENKDRREILRLIHFVHKRDMAIEMRRELHWASNACVKSPELSHDMSDISTLKESMMVALKAEMSSFRRKINESLDEIKMELSKRDIILECLETAVTSSVEVLEGLKVRLEENLGAGNVFRSALVRERGLRKESIESMLRRTIILNRDERKDSHVRSLFEKLYDGSEMTSFLMNFLKGQPLWQVMIDCDCYHIGNMKKYLWDYDGVERDGSNCYSFADFSKLTVYLGGKVDESREEARVVGLLAQSLARMSLMLAFQNGGRPYKRGDVLHEREFKMALIEAEGKMKRRDVLDANIRNAFNWKTQLGKEIHFATVVPALIPLYGSTVGINLLREQVPSLLGFFEDHVMATLLNNARE